MLKDTPVCSMGIIMIFLVEQEGYGKIGSISETEQVKDLVPTYSCIWSFVWYH